jgi:hypothetical protein
MLRPVFAALLLVAATGLGACSKCDVPTFGRALACTETPRR